MPPEETRTCILFDNDIQNNISVVSFPSLRWLPLCSEAQAAEKFMEVEQLNPAVLSSVSVGFTPHPCTSLFSLAFFSAAAY